MDMIKDEETKLKFQMMYDYVDYDNERTVLRNAFLNDVTKRSDLKEIGEILDKLTWQSKANDFDTYVASEDFGKYPGRAYKDYTSKDFSWAEPVVGHLDPKNPSFDDPSRFTNIQPEDFSKYEAVLEKVKYMDENRDNSTLSHEEKNEMALFHSMKQDPYFKHYL